MKQKFNVQGMHCAACVTHVKKAVENTAGVKSVDVSLMTQSMLVQYDEAKTTYDEIINSVINAGYDASLFEKKSFLNDTHLLAKKVWISISLLIVLMYISMADMLHLPLPYLSNHENMFAMILLQFSLTMGIVWCHKTYFINGSKALWNRSFNMDCLITIGTSAAILYSCYYAAQAILFPTMHINLHDYLYFESAGTILTFIAIGKWLEEKSKNKTREALEKLLNMTPKTAFLVTGDELTEVALDTLKVDDIVLVKPGGMIPIDGIVIEGESLVDTSTLTGESLPVIKTIGDSVSQATMNQNGYLKVKATKINEETLFSQMVQMVESATMQRAPIAKLADKVAGVFVPIVIFIALLTFCYWMIKGDFHFAVNSAISVLVISCPCALGLATPVSIMVATGMGAQHGVLIKNGEVLEKLHKIDTVVLDKTGTITQGKPSVKECEIFIDEDLFKTIVYTLEKNSEHPLSKAMMHYCEGALVKTVQSFEAIGGKGVKGMIEATVYLIGNARLMQENNISLNKAQKYHDVSDTIVYVADEKDLIGVFVISDKIKQSSQQAISKMQAIGLDVWMLTGDHQATAKTIAEQVGIKNVVAEVLPQGKNEVINDLKNKGKNVAMVGDGINDAVALVCANVGIAVGNGSDIALDSGQIVLMHNDLMGVYDSYRLSKATIKNIKENLFWAFIYNIIGIPLAAGVFVNLLNVRLSPMFAAFAMSMSSLFVLSNALRLKRFKFERKNEKMNKVLHISNMNCQHCAQRIQDAFNKAEVPCVISLSEKNVIVTSELSDDALKAIVEKVGYQVDTISTLKN